MEKEGENKISFNWEETKKFLIKYRVVLLLIIPIILSVWFRAYPFNLPITDTWAKDSVYNSIKQNIGDSIDAQYPDLLEQNRNILIDKEFQRVLSENKAEVDQQIESASQYFKSSMQDEKGHTYLPDIDSYLWLTQAKNYLKNGHVGDEIVNGTQRQMLRDGRLGVPVFFTLDPFMIAVFYKIGSIFSPDLTLMAAAFYVPLIFIAISIIPAFFIARRFGGNIAGLFAGVIVAINIASLSRTAAGFCDTDYFQIAFPLFITWAFIEAYEAITSNEKIKSIILIGISGLLTGLYIRAWSGWWYIFDIIVSSLFIFLVYQIAVYRKEIKKGILNLALNPSVKNPLVLLVLMIIFSGLFITLFMDFSLFFVGPLSALGFGQLKEVGISSLWPNVFTTVAEFNEIPLRDIIGQMGGNLFFLIALLGILMMIIPALVGKDKGKKEHHSLYALILIIWIAATAYSFTKGVRFAMLMVPPFAISFGIGISKIYEYAGKMLTDKMNLNSAIAKTGITIVILLLFITPIKAAHAAAIQEIPLMNDAWYDSLIEIKNNSTDAIITSWWDFGHWFVAISERRTTSDGGDQGRKIHWVGKTLLAEDEDLAVGLLRMLNCKQDEAYVKLDEYLNDTRKSVNLIYNIVVEDKQKAKEILKENMLTDEQADTILGMTHCDNLLDQYYIASGDMVGKAGVWSHFGSWDFRRADMYSSVSGTEKDEGIKILKEKFGKTENEAFNLYYEIQNTPGDQWITGWYSYKSDLTDCNVLPDLIQCGNGLQFNRTNNNAFFMTENGLKHPTSFVYPVEDIDENTNKTRETLYKEAYTTDTIPVSANLIKKEDGGFQSILMDEQLTNSMFTRLFFHRGRGLKHFELMSERTQFNGEKIYVYKVKF